MVLCVTYTSTVLDTLWQGKKLFVMLADKIPRINGVFDDNDTEFKSALCAGVSAQTNATLGPVQAAVIPWNELS